MSNQQLDDLNQEKADRELAEILGITYEEFSELDYNIDQETSNDGHPYGRYIQFNPEVGKDILKKIDLNSNNTFYF